MFDYWFLFNATFFSILSKKQYPLQLLSLLHSLKFILLFSLSISENDVCSVFQLRSQFSVSESMEHWSKACSIANFSKTQFDMTRYSKSHL